MVMVMIIKLTLHKHFILTKYFGMVVQCLVCITRMDSNIVNLTQYITDITNGCTFLDSLVSDSSTDATRIQEVIDGIEYQMGLSIVAR